ncbi:MarR family winged helix-turn-helix transcriptional regulator [Pedobacter cryoconitis]|uniref:DNA-binding MarR family transcriptional regulator n=1 Tax=Pedobacter cryoconitis TaxID=188932 RepID=A0A7X0J1X6_9SPHI|nr:MarR family transcriptional regulator [Pedobacter cryoconitis]MBB6499343.1 DNA-binding MarR family transcriptional regulator [Pedobacter cryoconitis]
MEQQDGTEDLIFRLVYLMKRVMDRWTESKLAGITPESLNVVHLPYFMSIGDHGISNHALIRKIKVTKQGVSKTVKELENLGLVYTEKSETDARSIMIFLSPQGKLLFDSIRQNGLELHTEYKKFVGTKNFDTTLSTLTKMIDFHERLENEA